MIPGHPQADLVAVNHYTNLALLSLRAGEAEALRQALAMWRTRCIVLRRRGLGELEAARVRHGVVIAGYLDGLGGA